MLALLELQNENSDFGLHENSRVGVAKRATFFYIILANFTKRPGQKSYDWKYEKMQIILIKIIPTEWKFIMQFISGRAYKVQ